MSRGIDQRLVIEGLKIAPKTSSSVSGQFDQTELKFIGDPAGDPNAGYVWDGFR